MTTENSLYLQPTPIIDADDPAVIDFARNTADGAVNAAEQAVRFYYAVRDGIRYDPYAIDLTAEGLRAGRTLAAGRGWCVAKAVLLAACCRSHGIPARLGFADVRNHLSTERLRAQMKTDIFHWHGYTSIFINGAWVKATPAFNIELCERFRIRPLEFDGTADSLYHPFDLKGNRHMEYLSHRGEFADVPVDAIIKTFMRAYSPDPSLGGADFDRDVDAETAGS